MKIINKHIKLIAVFLIVLSLVFLFFPCAAYDYYGELSYKVSGFQLIFGLKENGYAILSFNIVGLILLILILLCLVLVLLKNKIGRNALYIISLLLVICSIIYIYLPKSAVHVASEVDNLFVGLPFLFIGSIYTLASATLLFIIQFINDVNEKKENENENNIS